MDDVAEPGLAFARAPMAERLDNGRAAAFPSRVTVDLGALASNIRWIKARVGGDVALMAVLKAKRLWTWRGGGGARGAAKRR